MAKRTRQGPGKGPTKQGWWRQHKKVVISTCAAIGLILLTAIVSPLGGRIVDLVWPAPGSREDSGDQGPTSPAPEPGQRLVLVGQWPATYNQMCESSTKVAGLANAQPISALVRTANEDLRVSALNQLGATIWYHGKLLLTLTTTDDTPVLIMAIEPVVFAHRDAIPAWGLEVSPGCGGPSQMRVLQSVLDSGTLEDLGVSPIGPGNPRAPTEAIGHSFTVSNSDAADVLIEVNACQGLYEFGVKITYVDAGETLTSWFGSADAPLQIVGGWQGVERFHSMVVDSAPSGVLPGPLPLYPGATVSEDLPDSMSELCV